MSAARLFIAAGLLSALLGCSRGGGGAEWFPLDAGHVWQYDTTTRTDGDTEAHETLTLRSLGRADLDGHTTWRRRSDSGLDYWLRSDDSGIYRVASKTDLELDPNPDVAPRYVLRAPFSAGTQWMASTTAYLLRRKNEFPPEIRYVHPSIPMSYSIEALDQAVKVPAGSFTGCMRVKGTAQLRLYADAVAGWRDLPLITREWYCRGVGLVRLEREEPSTSSFVTGGTLTMELTQWR